MQPLKEFSLPIKGLKTGIHNFEFHIDQRFFQNFPDSTISKGEFVVLVHLERRPDLLIFDLDIKGELNDECDRCLNEIDIPIHGVHRMMMKFSDEEFENEDIVYVSENDHEINISKYLYEFIHLSLPIQKIRDCESENYKFCNKKILENIFGNADDTDQEDSGWDALKNIKL